MSRKIPSVDVVDRDKLISENIPAIRRFLLSQLQRHRCLLCDKQHESITPADLTCVLIMEKKKVTQYGYICNECGCHDEEVVRRAAERLAARFTTDSVTH
jgi:hypothetical protein